MTAINDHDFYYGSSISAPLGVHPTAKVHMSARINCQHLKIGAGSVIGAGCVIEGTRVEIGREFWMDEGARIGGGSCHDPQAFLKAGDWLHLGKNSELNIARGITIGDEVGIGIESKLFTHGAYLDELAGFPCEFAPITIGSRVWMPNAWVNPGVTIGNEVVVAARSLVNRNIFDGAFAAGIPIKIVRNNQYPRVLTNEEKEKILDRIIDECISIEPSIVIIRNKKEIVVAVDAPGSIVDIDTRFDVEHRTIRGLVSKHTEVVRNQLRRHGIRFRFSPRFGVPSAFVEYVAWDSES